MKKIVLLSVLCAFAVTAFAQKAIFDVLTYSAPKGWEKEGNESAISYTTVKNKSWCRIIIYKSTISKGSIEEDFENEWQGLVVNVNGSVKTEPSNEVQELDGWKIKIGSAKCSDTRNKNEIL